MTILAYQAIADYYDNRLAMLISATHIASTGNELVIRDAMLRTTKVIISLCFEENWLPAIRALVKEKKKTEDPKRLANTIKTAKRLVAELRLVNANMGCGRAIPSNALTYISQLMEASTPERASAKKTSIDTHLTALVRSKLFTDWKGATTSSPRVFNPTVAFKEAVLALNSPEGLDLKSFMIKHYGPDSKRPISLSKDSNKMVVTTPSGHAISMPKIRCSTAAVIALVVGLSTFQLPDDATASSFNLSTLSFEQAPEIGLFRYPYVSPTAAGTMNARLMAIILTNTNKEDVLSRAMIDVNYSNMNAFTQADSYADKTWDINNKYQHVFKSIGVVTSIQELADTENAIELDRGALQVTVNAEWQYNKIRKSYPGVTNDISNDLRLMTKSLVTDAKQELLMQFVDAKDSTTFFSPGSLPGQVPFLPPAQKN
ncbi:MAG: hypothetical protein COB76_07020 [Alphaproteobacteria bacterium]|nr:MAG: hypothetical protein COB76_07020 [Alphaproteobacteria bacterium]